MGRALSKKWQPPHPVSGMASHWKGDFNFTWKFWISHSWTPPKKHKVEVGSFDWRRNWFNFLANFNFTIFPAGFRILEKSQSLARVGFCMPVFVEACQPSAIHGCCEKRCCCCWKSHFYGTVKLVFRVWNGDDDNEDVLLLDQSFKFGGKGMRCVGTGFGFCFTNQVCKDFGSQFSTRQTGLDSWLPKCT